MTKPEIDQDDIHEIWDCSLDGCSIRYIHENKVSLSRKVIAAVLAGPVPERFKDDERLLPSRYVWLAAGGMKDGNDKDIAFIILKFPRGITQVNYRKGVRAIERDIVAMSDRGWLNGHVTEILEIAVAEKFVVTHGNPGWEIDLTGQTRKLGPDDFENTVAAAPII
jgi:hypothetical protein